jgi:hypothetical protein
MKKFRHYLLGNSFIFFVNHYALIYMLNKSMVTSQIARWFLLLQEFDLKIVYKPNKVHFLPNHLSRISHGELAKGVDDQLPNAHLFIVGVDWYGPIIEYLKKKYFDYNVLKEKRS